MDHGSERRQRYGADFRHRREPGGLNGKPDRRAPAICVTGLVSTNANVSYTSAQTAAILSSGLNVSASGAYTVTENFANGNYSVYRGGELIQQKSVNPDGSYDVAYFDVTGKTYSSLEDIYNSAGTLRRTRRTM